MKIDEILKTRKPGRTWFDRLDAKQKKLALEVKERVKADGLPHQPVAKNLVEALSLSISVQTVCKWFHE